MSIIRIKRDDVQKRREERLATQIKAEQYRLFVGKSLETPKRFYTNLNKGVTL